MGVDPDGRIVFLPILIGAAIGGVVNLGVKAYQGKINTWGDGFAAFGIGAVGGAVTAATGGAIAGAAGLSMSTVAGGALAGASGAVFGSPVQGMGNAMYFGDAYSGGQFLTDIVAGGILGGVAGGVAGWIKNAKSAKVGGPKIDPWGFKSAGKGKGVVEWGELKLSKQQDGFDLNYANPSKNRPPIEGMEYLDEGVRSTPQPFAGGGQFSSSIIDDAVSLVMKDARKLEHLFPAKHNLGPLVNKLGGQENTVRAVLNAAKGKLPASGLFKDIPVNVSGSTVFIRGNVINGVPRIGTMFIP